MRIALAQIDPVVGDFDGNVRKIAQAYERACQAQARLLLTPELSVCGYPPYDLIDRPEMFERNERALAKIAALTQGKKTALAIGHIARNPSNTGRAAQNVATIYEDGKAVYTQAKTLLPTYDVFDEARYFEPATDTHLWECDGHKIGVAICEDLWGNDPAFGRTLYGQSPIERLKKLKPELVLSLSSSPYEWGKRERREELHAEVASAVGAQALLYVNQVGATDDVLFDGGSFAVERTGKLVGRMPFFRTGFGLVDHDFKTGKSQWVESAGLETDREDMPPEEIEILARGLITGIREYFARTGFKIGILGLSGGIDSAVVAVLAAQAIGAKNLLGVAMPSQHSSGHSMEDAEALAAKLGMPFEVRPIKFLYSTATREITDRRGELAPIALENMQSRLRGLVLMTLSNHYSGLVFTTGNKSELATGYGTLYGDMCGALGPIGDVLKTRVYELARHLNKAYGNAIPERSITKAPSAELRPGQTDQDTLPPYDLLDALLEDYIERALPLEELQKKYAAAKGAKSPEWVAETIRRVELNEFKRRQAAPVLKVSHKAFGIGRRIPIAKVWDQSL